MGIQGILGIKVSGLAQIIAEPIPPILIDSFSSIAFGELPFQFFDADPSQMLFDCREIYCAKRALDGPG